MINLSPQVSDVFAGNLLEPHLNKIVLGIFGS